MSIKPLLVSTFDLEGGAARAAHRLHRGLLRAGLSSNLLVQMQSGDTEGVIGPVGRRDRALARMRPVLDNAILGLYRQRPGTMVSPAWLPGGAARRIRDIEHDVLNLHWVAAGFLSIEGAGRQEKPIVWTLHDMWLLTGGCHYSGKCERYRNECGRCPQLGSDQSTDLSRLVWKRKSRAWRELSISVVSPTMWLAEAARNASLLEGASIRVIPNGVDIDRFQPLDRYMAREAFGLPQDKTLVAFGALSVSERRKGGVLLLEALSKMADRIPPDSVELVVFGASHERGQGVTSVPARYVGRLADDVSLALLYSAVDIVVVPSLYEAHSLIAIEAMACATPCVAFRVEGLSEVIDHGTNGLLATPFDTGALADAIAELATNDSVRGQMATTARAKALERWDISLVAEQYEALYASIA
jgi:glycosyltransferase involved in cell wall biosynthesis